MDVYKCTIHKEGILKPKYHSFSYKVFINRAQAKGRKVFLPLFEQISYLLTFLQLQDLLSLSPSLLGPAIPFFETQKNYNEILIAIIILERHRHLLLDRFDCIVIILAKNTPRTASL